MHDALTIGIPLLAIFAGILFNRAESKEIRSEMGSLRAELRAEMRDLRAEINGRFDRVDAELRYFHGYMGKLEGRIEALEKKS